MGEQEIYQRIREVLNEAPRNQYTVELHLQMIKYADSLKHISAREFCEGAGISHNFGAEFSKMRNLSSRLQAAGLRTEKL